MDVGPKQLRFRPEIPVGGSMSPSITFSPILKLSHSQLRWMAPFRHPLSGIFGRKNDEPGVSIRTDRNAITGFSPNRGEIR